MKELEAAEGFDWDEGNRDKNWASHNVRSAECEMVFFNQPLVVIHDAKHSEFESRFFAFGKTGAGRNLLIVFCLRKNKIRIISARDMNNRERKFYANQ